MTHLRLFLVAALCLLVSSFLPRDTADFRPADITEMVFLQPVGVVSSVAQGNQLRYDAYASLDASEAMRQALLRHDEKLHLERQIIIKDTALQQVAAQLTLGAVGQLERVHKRPLSLPAPWLDTLLAQRRQRYCLLS
jgi:hypothetical protein